MKFSQKRKIQREQSKVKDKRSHEHNPEGTLYKHECLCSRTPDYIDELPDTLPSCVNPRYFVWTNSSWKDITHTIPQGDFLC